MFPDDLLRSIFGVVVQNFNIQKDLDYAVPIQFVLCTVCRQWRDLIHSTPLLWTDIHIPTTAPYDTFIFFERSNPALIDVNFANSYTWASSEMTLHSKVSEAIAKHIERLRSLRIRVLNLHELPPVFDRWKDMKCPNFEELCMSIDVGGVDEPGFGFSVLRSLKLDRWWMDGTALRTLRLERLPFSDFPVTPNLTTLELDRVYGSKENMKRIFDQSPALETLIIRQFAGSGGWPDEHPTSLESTSSTLKSLALNLSTHDDPDCDCPLPSLSAPNLENLELAYSWITVTNHTLSALNHLSSFSHLKRFRITCYSFWENDISFISKLPKGIKLEIIGFPPNQNDNLFTIIRAANLGSVILDLTYNPSRPARHLDPEEFIDLILDKRPNFNYPFLFCYQPDADKRKETARKLTSLFGDNLSVQFAPVKPWFLSDFRTILSIMDDEEAFIDNLFGGGSSDFEEEDEFDLQEEEFYDYEAAFGLDDINDFEEDGPDAYVEDEGEMYDHEPDDDPYQDLY
ncbi:hypothetical protein CPB83DRAFT_878607 [Crepidotus variabilis]|uniref:F-box domain-containing protein n=1 Tax=Crepidotus variabilis TaxID=179855 RepID=A0A9P6EV31_9AGAR|nr:hypothetical protein CPB83DRAFT_878607 [Crepidotus variabilis]